MINEAKQSPFYQDLNEIYKERERIFQQREQDYLKQKNALNNLLEAIKQEKSELGKIAQEQERKMEELKREKQSQQTWYQQICEERKQIEKEREELKKAEAILQSQKDAVEVQYRVQIEKAKNTEIIAKQKEEEFEHKLDMIGLVLDADGKPGEKSTKFFESLLGGTQNVNLEEQQKLEEENEQHKKEVKQLRIQLNDLKEKNKQLQIEKDHLSADIQKEKEEKNRLLEWVASISDNKVKEEIQNEPDVNVPNFETEEIEMEQESLKEEEEYVPTFGKRKKFEEVKRKEDVFEELTASVLQRYLAKNEAKYISSEIKHSNEGEQLHVNINNLDYVFLFSQPAAFEISAPKKKSRALDRLLIRLNTQHPGVKFYFDEQENRVYASGYFSNTMTPERLMEKVHEVSDCFRQK